jgi:hypothetical protein
MAVWIIGMAAVGCGAQAGTRTRARVAHDLWWDNHSHS